MELFYSSGLRLAELLGLDLVDLDLRDRTVRVLGKGRKARIVPVGRHAVEALAQWLRERAALAAVDETAVFVGRERPAARAAHRAAAHRPLGAPAGPARARAPAPVPPFVRLAPARVVGRPARGAGTARATPTSARPRCTRTLISSTWPASTTPPTPGRGARGPRMSTLRSPRHHHPVRAPQRPRRHGRRRPGHARQHRHEGQRPQGAPPARGPGDRRLRRRHGRRLHAVRALRGQAAAVRQPDARRDRAGQGLAHRPQPAPPRGAAVRRRRRRTRSSSPATAT